MIEADQSEPPRPRVVATPPARGADEAGQHRAPCRASSSGSSVSRTRGRRSPPGAGVARPKALVGDDHARARPRPARGRPRGVEGGGHDLAGQALAHAGDRVQRARGQLAEVVDAGVEARAARRRTASTWSSEALLRRRLRERARR